ncbi:unnamed protein product [Aphanomyces euteiches]|uniref:Ketoreductase (KR) domain-containing protein n=1 Tax=Aphanomyces euteiches TaxID=100861 RepID=A0A6G0WRF2_9STRA|nr:hypothetical protein Ae201684_012474 [Aphanomyces euteiches]KAH9090442.1 hypothetical protein Ae201684P_014244 [Aphanomyces euteiches]KAH9152219.1 hypothetical protein AeRB84_005317 [Aphanomyces euteiches]
MTYSARDIPDQSGRVAIVTGGTAGIGYESVLALARKGCHVIFTARSTARGEETLAKIKSVLEPASFQVEYAVVNNEDLESISAFAASVLARNLPLHVLLLNAGVSMVPVVSRGSRNQHTNGGAAHSRETWRRVLITTEQNQD